MKETTRTSRTAGLLEKMFRKINEDLFENSLEEPIITIQSTKGAYGHVTVSKIWKKKEEDRHELNISADYLERPIEEVVKTMVHEMCHLENLRLNIQDCSRGGAYHNKKFKEMAEKHMLKCTHHEKYGWTICEPTEELLDYIIKQGWEDIQMNRGQISFTGATGGNGNTTGISTGQQITPKKKSSRKYVCPVCGTIIRATKEVNVVCGICDTTFREV